MENIFINYKKNRKINQRIKEYLEKNDIYKKLENHKLQC